MKIEKVLLRWYKSFNVNYQGYDDRKSNIIHRPWNKLRPEITAENDFEFLEIEIEGDITTIIGANESGKSHLLSAISKVLAGRGITAESEYKISDLCYYSSVKSINTDIWPNIGIEFSITDPLEFDKVLSICNITGYPNTSIVPLNRVVIILNQISKKEHALLYINSDETPTIVSKNTLDELRTLFPKVEFIDSSLAISDQISLSQLIVNYGNNEEEENEYYEDMQAQFAAKLIAQMRVDEAGNVSGFDANALRDATKKTRSSKLVASKSGMLETLLFRDILNVESDTLKTLQNLGQKNRSFAEGIVSQWNQKIEETLNLSKYWQQDEYFRLKLNLKNNVLYFEILDKTNSTFTFKDRSSGLRYFLSYYIQAKALELSRKNSYCVILMDEPDSFLSSLGQKNLIQVFESLVRPEVGSENCQLIYTTHSPFLINKNFPKRIRLLKKGDAEEGSQHVRNAALRRYEPIRSALGIDCAQTLFLGSTNLIVEGPTDQYILTELIRTLNTPNQVTEYLDLNEIVLVSAESSSRIEQLLMASSWGDEEAQSTVVLLDADEAGDQVKGNITGKNRRKKELIKEQYVLTYKSIFPDIENHVTIEDVFPVSFYSRAVKDYLIKWENIKEGDAQKIHEEIIKLYDENPNSGICQAVKNAMNNTYSYDKMGVSEVLIDMIKSDPSSIEIEKIRKTIMQICSTVREIINESKIEISRTSFKIRVQRIIKDFFNLNQNASTVTEVRLLANRLAIEAEATTAVIDKFYDFNSELGKAINMFQSQGIVNLEANSWKSWRNEINKLRQNPMDPIACDLDALIQESKGDSLEEKKTNSEAETETEPIKSA